MSTKAPPEPRARRNGDWPQEKVTARMKVAVPELLRLGELDALRAVQYAIWNGEDPEAYVHRRMRELEGMIDGLPPSASPR